MQSMKAVSIAALGALVFLAIVFFGCPQASSGSGGSAATVTTITELSQIPAGSWRYVSSRTELIKGLNKTYAIPVTATIVATGTATVSFTLVADYTAVVTDAVSMNLGTASAIWASNQSTVGAFYYNYGSVTYSKTSPYTVTATAQKTDKDIAGKTVTLSGSTTLSVPIPDLASGNDSIWLFIKQ
jgi:hypothetical protein